jgi:hypothetical protein
MAWALLIQCDSLMRRPSDHKRLREALMDAQADVKSS